MNITIFKDFQEYSHCLAVRLSQSKTVECASDPFAYIGQCICTHISLGGFFFELNITIVKDCLEYRHCVAVRMSQSKTVELASDPLAYIRQCICAHISLGGFFLKLTITIFKDCLEYKHYVAVRLS